MAACAVIAIGTFLVSDPLRAQSRSKFVHQRHFRVLGPDGQSQRVLATYPRRQDGKEFSDSTRTPILVALHGRGEALRGPERGFLGWNVDYELPDAFGLLRRGSLLRGDYRGYARKRYLDEVNEALRAKPFRGVLVVTPYTPDLLGPSHETGLQAFCSWVAGPFLRQVRERFPLAATTREGTGIDGVSLGGMVALEAGFRHPEAFGAVGGIQPAITGREKDLAARARQAQTRGLPQKIRLLTSDGDPFLASTRKLSEELRRVGIEHTLTVVPGPHDYSFNRGPGRLELLRFHDVALEWKPVRNTPQ